MDPPRLSAGVRTTARVLGWFLAFDLIGVLLTLLVDMAVVLHRRFEGSSPLAYVIWFVVGVFCAVCIYMGQTENDDYDSAEGRKRGQKLVVITALVAGALGFFASLVWSGDAREAVAPDHRGVTITYLVTVVLTVTLARFGLFREVPSDLMSVAFARRESELLRANLAKSLLPSRRARDLDSRSKGTNLGDESPKEDTAFKPAGFWGTLGFLTGVPLLLFLDVSFFLLGPFDFFDRWTAPLLAGSLASGLLWGFSSARWKNPRDALLVFHTPLLIGTLFYFGAVLLGGVLVVIGATEGAIEVLCWVAFGAGFLLGCAAFVGWYAELFERPKSSDATRSKPPTSK
jgi:hypothetical protein